MLIDSFSEKLVNQRGFGAFPREIFSNDNSDPLVKVLAVEYKINVFDPDTDNLSQLTQESQNLSVSLEKGSLVETIARLNYGNLLVLSQNYDEAVKVLNDTVVEESSFNYVQSLSYKKYYLLATSLKAIKDPRVNEAVLKGINQFKIIPNMSNVESNKWLNLLFDLLSISSIPELQSIFKSHNFILRYLIYKKINLSGSEEFITKRANEVIQSTQFPNSYESNNSELEEFLELVTDSNFVNTHAKKDLLEKGIARTYQSHVLLRSLTKTFVQLGDFSQLKASFQVYIDYIENYYILNNHSYNDLLSILSLHDEVLNNSSADLEFKGKVLTNFKKLLQEFNNSNEIVQINDETDIFEKTPRYLSIETSQLLSQYWSTIGSVTFDINKNSKLISEDLNDLKSSLTHYKSSIYLSPRTETIFQYALKLAIFRDYKKSYKVLKQLLKTLQGNSIIYFKLFHLLALILSIEENKEESFKIITFLSQEVEDYIKTTPVIQLEFKTQFVEIEISKLAIIEALYGIEQTLDSLPELFNLYNQLFENDTKESLPAVPMKHTHKSSRSINSASLSKIKRELTHSALRPPPPQPKSSPASPSRSQFESITLQKIWLLSATIYAKLKLFKESEEAIIEAENSLYPSFETHSTLGLITSTTRPKFALQEFEISLDSQLSLTSIVGFSNLMLNDSSVFIDEKDKLAGIARAKLLLETIVETFEGFYSSEVWWLLSLIYERFGDEARLKKSLWKSVELEESRPVRDFTVIEK